MTEAIYVMLRGDTQWTLLYFGNDFRKVHPVITWAEIHCMTMRRVRMIDNTTCILDGKISRQERLPKNKFLSMFQ